MNRFRRLFRSSQPIPADYQRIFSLLYRDVAWFGVINGATLSFLIVYTARLGATPEQVGIINAAPAIINLLIALPAGRWLQKQPVGKAVFWTSVATRIFYLFLVPLPWFFSNQEQINVIVLLILAMNIPATALTVGFNAMFAEAVPAEYRGYVMGTRNALLAVVSVVSTLISGQILDRVPFPLGYQIVFLIGFIGAAMSSYYLYQLRHMKLAGDVPVEPELSSEQNKIDTKPANSRYSFLLLNQLRRFQLARFEILRGPFGGVLGLLFFFHFTQYLGIPLFPLMTVNVLGFSDQVISLGSSIFSGLVFLGSLRLGALTVRLGSKRLLGFGILGLGLFPTILAFIHSAGLYFVVSMIGGLAWSMVGGALYNYLVERVPDNDRPSYLAWYNLGLNAAILAGSLAGPLLSSWVGIINVLILCGVLRFIAGLSILRWG